MQPQAISFIGKILAFRPRHPKLDWNQEFLPQSVTTSIPVVFYMDSFGVPPPTSAPLPPIASSKRHDFSFRVSVFLVADKQEGQSKALLKGSIFYLDFFTATASAMHARKGKSRVIGKICRAWNLTVIRDSWLIYPNKHIHIPYWKYIVTWSVWEITCEESFGVIFTEYKGAFYSSEAQFAETGSNVKVQESIGVKVQFETGRPPCCSYQICVEVEPSWRGS